MPETTKIPVKPSKANGMKDKKWITFIRIESNENAQNVSWASFHTIDTNSPICVDFSALIPM